MLINPCQFGSQTGRIGVKCILRKVIRGSITHDALLFACPGCIAGGPDGYDGIHLLPVNTTEYSPSWDFDGNLEAPTLSPSILTHGGYGKAKCHSFLRSGVFEFLSDSTHPLSGKKVPIPDLPDWALKEVRTPR